MENGSSSSGPSVEKDGKGMTMTYYDADAC